MKKILVHTLATAWNEPPRARHQVTNELRKEGIVYFVEKEKFGVPRVEINLVEPNFYVITPYYWLDYRVRYRTPGINEMFYKWLFNSIKSLNIAFDFVVTFDFTAPSIHDYFSNVIFYCADENVGLGNFTPPFVISYHTKTEKLVAVKSKLCIVTSDYMLTKIRQYNDETYLVPLGAPEIKRTIAYRESNGRTPVLALVGYLEKNMDFPLLHQLLQTFKILFIGPISEEAKKGFLKYPNAVFAGVKTGNELYSLLETVDVCIAPYDINIINKGLTPNKLWLYLAVGKPVVVTDIPNIKSWIFEEKLVYKCQNKDFKEKCFVAFTDNNSMLTRKRIEVARNNSWNRRVKVILEHFNISKETNLCLNPQN